MPYSDDRYAYVRTARNTASPSSAHMYGARADVLLISASSIAFIVTRGIRIAAIRERNAAASDE